MLDLGELAFRLSEASETNTATERLVEHLRATAPDAAIRVYLVGLGDRCATCTRVQDCPTRDRCFHLTATVGSFENPRGHDQRVPRNSSPWADAFGSTDTLRPETIPGELAGGAVGEGCLLMPMEGDGEPLGVIGVRAAPDVLDAVAPGVRAASFLAAAVLQSLTSRKTASRRFEQLLLVNELGRKVNSILNDDLLMRQAAVDIHRTFGFHNVMIFMVDADRSSLELKAQSSRYAAPTHTDSHVGLDEGVTGRVFRTGSTEAIDDVSVEDDYVDWFKDTRSEIAVPIQIGGVVEGVLNVESDRVGAFGPSEKLVLETVANQLAIAIENARLFGMVKEREDRYRTLVESSPGGVLHLDADSHVVYANPAVTEITGFEKAHILSHFPKVADLAIEAEQPVFAVAIQDALRGVPRRDLDFHLRHAEGGTRWVSLSLQPLLGDHGVPKGVVVLMRDKTRERELQDKLTQSEKLSAIGNLVSGVAHELNNPLAGILGFAQLLIGRDPSGWTRQDIEKIEKNAKRCQQIVENLLAFARQGRITKRRADINDIIESVLDLNEYQFRMDNIEIERDFDRNIPRFMLDVNKMQQVFVNLASNAHQALMNSDADELRIRLETRRDGNSVTVRISDTGPGIPDHIRHRVFEPFFTTKEKGTGLGLGICFGIVEEHEGTILAEDDPAGGAVFTVVVPIVETPEVLPLPEPVETDTDSAYASGRGKGKRVLVVDDDQTVCDVVSRALANHDYDITVAYDGMEALAALEQAEFDVILTDIRMPGEVDGIELFDRVTSKRPELTRHFVFMTGNLLDNRTMGRLERMRLRFIEKPFDIHRLASVVHEVAALPPAPAQTSAPVDDA